MIDKFLDFVQSSNLLPIYAAVCGFAVLFDFSLIRLSKMTMPFESKCEEWADGMIQRSLINGTAFPRFSLIEKICWGCFGLVNFIFMYLISDSGRGLTEYDPDFSTNTSTVINDYLDASRNVHLMGHVWKLPTLELLGLSWNPLDLILLLTIVGWVVLIMRIRVFALIKERYQNPQKVNS